MAFDTFKYNKKFKKFCLYITINFVIFICISSALFAIFKGSVQLLINIFVTINIIAFFTYLTNDAIYLIAKKHPFLKTKNIPIIFTLFSNYFIYELVFYLLFRYKLNLVMTESNKFYFYIWSFLLTFVYAIYNHQQIRKYEQSEITYVPLNKKSKKRINNISYTPVTISNKKEKKKREIIRYIGENYNDPELTLIKISRKCKINSRQISPILNEAFNLTFSQYLNTIRLTEAKRLLQETNYSIIEIALGVGFNTIAHFNHIFKDAEKKSPSTYRKEYNLSIK